MIEIYQCGEDSEAHDRKKAELESLGYKYECKIEDTPESQAIADLKRDELTKAGFDVAIL